MQNLIFQFSPKKHIEVVLAISKQKFWIFRIILKLFYCGNCFHTMISFCFKGPQKSLFWDNFDFSIQNRQNCQFSKNGNFQGLLQEKLMVVWKTFLGIKDFKIIRKIQKLCSEFAKTTSRLFFWRKSKNQILPFWAIFYLW